MNSTKKLIGGFLMFAVCLGTAFAEHRVNKKKKITVTVEQDANCSQGISISGDSLGDRQLCADYPQGVGDHFQKYVGTTVEVEARWAFDGNTKTDAPIALGKVYKIGREKINDPCAVGKVGFLAGVMMVANGADPDATVASLTTGCNTGASDTSGDGDQQ
jgi:hypothetical protein